MRDMKADAYSDEPTENCNPNVQFLALLGTLAFFSSLFCPLIVSVLVHSPCSHEPRFQLQQAAIIKKVLPSSKQLTDQVSH